MAILLLVAPLLAVGLALGYRFSEVNAARKKAIAAVEPLRNLQNDLTNQADDIRNGVFQAAEHLRREVFTARLRSISLDRIKQHAAGLRLQALKDVGLSTLFDIQGWSAERLSNLRGVGPKSAGTIAAVAQSLIASSNAQPLMPPSPPFHNAAELSLVRALYVQFYFEAHHAAEKLVLKNLLERSEEKLAEIVSGTTFASWSMSLLGVKRASLTRDSAEALTRELEESASALGVRRCVEKHVDDLRSIRMRSITREELLASYVNEPHLYQWMLADALGQRQPLPRPVPRQQSNAIAFVTPATGSSDDPAAVLLEGSAGSLMERVPENSSNTLSFGLSEPAHVEFGRLVAGPPPQPTLQPTVEAGTSSQDQIPQSAPWLIKSTDNTSSKQVCSPQKTPEVQPSELCLDEAVHVEFGRLVTGPPPVLQPQPDEPMSAFHFVTKTKEQALQQLERVQAAREADRQTDKSVASQSGIAAEEFVTLHIGQPVANSEIPLPAPPEMPASQRGRLRWVNASETVVVQGVTISGSQFFLGHTKRNAEPYVVDPALPVAEEFQHLGEESALTHRYASFSPYVRFRYLHWLAGGAKVRDIPSGFAKLYFQSLERRLLEHLKQPANVPPEQIEALLEEVRRIDRLFLLTPNAVTYQAKCLLQFFEARSFIGAAMPALPARTGKGEELPFQLRLGLGCFIKESEPIPSSWALNWAYAEPTIFLRTAPLRCPDEFEAAFLHLYEERYDRGMVIKANRTMLRVDYQPMWSGGDDSKVELTFTEVPDVKALSAPQATLGKLVTDATDLIDKYSRSLGPTGKGAGTLEALLRLPGVLWNPGAKAKLDAFRSQFVDPMVPLTSDDLIAALEGDGEAGSTRIVEIARHLRPFGIGLEPDVLTGSRRPKSSDYLVLFPLPDKREEMGAGLAQAPTVAVTLAAILALADGHASEEEASAADGLVERWPSLSEEDQVRLRAVYRLTLRQPPALATFKSRLAALSVDHRYQVASALTKMAASDGVVSPDEVHLLERIYRMLSLEAHTLYSDLHGASGSSPQAKGASGGVGSTFLDPARLTLLRAQSSEVGELLAGVFLEEVDPLAPVPVTAEAINPERQMQTSIPEFRSLSGLSATDREFVAFLITKPMWVRQDLVQCAATFQIMLDGTLERINEAALDQLGDFLIEGDDPLYVQQTLLETAE